MKTITIIRWHSLILIACSLTGLSGYYFQNHYFQVTACIPATVGISLLLISTIQLNKKLKHFLLFVITLVFGIIVTRMAIRFIPQEFQPLRKRIYFPIMAVSSLFTLITTISNHFSQNK